MLLNYAPTPQKATTRAAWNIMTKTVVLVVQPAQRAYTASSRRPVTSILDSTYGSSIQQAPLNHAPRGLLGLG